LAKLIYIGGYGRSGSTLLEYLLTAHGEVVACGEIERHLRSFGKKKICTCGRRMRDCPVWSDFRHKTGRVKGLDHAQLTLALLEHVSPHYQAMVDSSKTAGGAAFDPMPLWRALGDDFLLVQIVRDARGVSWSAIRTPWRPKKKRNDSAPVAALRTAFGWIAANLACEAFRWRHPKNAMRVRYEDLVKAPEQVVVAILARAGLPPLQNLDGIAGNDNRHQLHGNAMRFKPLSPAELKEDVAWKTAMPSAYRRLVSVLCWPLLRRYGY
jgi:sulfotransferase family protein